MTNENSPAIRLCASNLVGRLNAAIADGKQVSADQVFSYLDHHSCARPDEQVDVLKLALAATRVDTQACAILTDCLKQANEAFPAATSASGA